MILSLKGIRIGSAILLAVIVVLVIGLVGCGQAQDRPSDRSVREVAQAKPTEPTATGQGNSQGEGLYATYCRSCHGENGTGTPITRVALKDAARGMDQATLTRSISKGQPGVSMPAFENTLTQPQITDLVTFIRSW